jgi:hypothetical protein
VSDYSRRERRGNVWIFLQQLIKRPSTGQEESSVKVTAVNNQARQLQGVVVYWLDSQECEVSVLLDQPFSTFLPWRNPWNNFQVSGNPCIKIVIGVYTAHGTLAWSVSCRYNNPIIIVNALLSWECYFSVDLSILANKLKKNMFIFLITISRRTLRFRGTPVEKPCTRQCVLRRTCVWTETWNCWEIVDAGLSSITRR